jgi:4-hydroxybenzoate polyprenyltransferase
MDGPSLRRGDMKKQELILFLVALALIAAGMTWLIGAYGLIASGVALLASAFFIDFEKEE